METKNNLFLEVSVNGSKFRAMGSLEIDERFCPQLKERFLLKE